MLRTTISDALRKALFAPQTDEVALVLLTLTHDDMPDPIRVVHNTENIVSRGNTFLACSFDIQLPQEHEGQVPTTTLRIDNVDQRIIAAVRGLSSSPSANLEIVLASSPDTVEVSYPDLTFGKIGYDVFAVEGDLSYESLAAEPFPADIFGPATFPALFG